MNHGLAAFLAGQLGDLAEGLLPGFVADPWGALRDEFVEPFRDWVQDHIDNIGASAYQAALERVRDLAYAMDTAQEIFHDIGEAVGDALDSGETAPQTDGGMGEVYDTFTPDGEVPFEVGTLPGFSSDGAGLNRNEGGGGGSEWTGAPSGGSTSPTPLGQSGGNTPPQPPMDTGPSLQDLGVDPDSGGYVEYQPGEGQAVIHYPDGRTETYPWP